MPGVRAAAAGAAQAAGTRRRDEEDDSGGQAERVPQVPAADHEGVRDLQRNPLPRVQRVVELADAGDGAIVAGAEGPRPPQRVALGSWRAGIPTEVRKT